MLTTYTPEKMPHVTVLAHGPGRARDVAATLSDPTCPVVVIPLETLQALPSVRDGSWRKLYEDLWKLSNPGKPFLTLGDLEMEDGRLGDFLDTYPNACPSRLGIALADAKNVEEVWALWAANEESVWDGE